MPEIDDPQNVARLASLKQQRSTARSNITRIKNMLDASASTWNEIDLNCRLEILNSYIKQLMAYQTEIEKDDPADAKRAEVEELCISAKSKLMQLLAQYKSHESTLLDHTIGVSIPQYTRLPKLKLPNFDGKYSDYKNFMSSFTKLVHDDHNLAIIEKFNHLLSCLSGDALRTVKSFQICEENYAKALDRLKERYDKKCLIFFDNVDQLFDLPKMHKPNASELRNAVDTVSAVYDSLRSLGSEKDITNALIIHLVLSKVDSITRSKWNDHCDYSKLPTWDDCSKVLVRRIQSLEVNDDRSSSNKSESGHQQNKTKKSDFKSSFACSKTDGNNCVFCKSSNHGIHNCGGFSSLPIGERFNFVKKSGLCINCLKKGHSMRSCSSSQCKVCHRPHHTLLHRFDCTVTTPQQQISVANSVPQPNQTSSLHVSSENEVVVLATALVKIKNRFGEMRTVRALLDSGSQVNLMSEECAHNLHLKREFEKLNLSGIGESKACVKQKVNATVLSRFNAYEFQADFWVMKSISNYQPDMDFSIDSWKVPPNVELADPNFYKRQRVDLLIGADVFFDLLSVGQIKLQDSLPTLQKTLLGWIVSGRYKSSIKSKELSCNLVDSLGRIDEDSIDSILRKFWEIEESPHSWNKLTEEHLSCENHFVDNTTLLGSGRFEVRLPFKLDCTSLGSSYDTAKRRYLALERKLSRTPYVREMYMSFMKEYISLGHMSPTNDDVPNEPHYFIPHQVVIRPESLTTKLRVVFDASSKTSSQTSLNDTLMVGATIQPDLYITLLRFRCHKFAITSDITKMYRQVMVHEADRNYQLILWREDANKPIQIYRLNTVTYGTASAPFLAIRCLKEIGVRNEEKYPLGSKIIKENFYVDDMLAGAESLEELTRIQNEVVTILKSAGFQLSKWYSNHEQLSQKDNVGDSVSFNDTDSTKTLGIVWYPKSDEFMFNVVDELDHVRPTKRNILSASSKLYDPLGLLCPVITRAKLILQELWLQKLDWDESVPMSIATSWNNFKDSLKNIKNVRIPRYVNTSSKQSIEIHGFADASMRAYGCCLYVRAKKGNKFESRLLTAKSKVAPLKTQTLPRLELCAAHLLAKVWQAIAPHFVPYAEKITFWSDSEIVLYWLKKHPSALSTFVGNRISEIQNWASEVSWRHVPTAHNPADIASRSCNVEELLQSIWFSGPLFLTKDQAEWPINKNFEPNDKLKNLESRKTKSILIAVEKQSNVINEIVEKCSSYTKLVKIVAYIYRFMKPKLSKPDTSQITTSELKLSFLKIIEIIQQDSYADQIHSIENAITVKPQLQKLNPFVQILEKEGRTFKLLRVGGRLLNAQLSYNTKFPLILPKTSRFVILYVTHLHLSNCHAGPKALVGLIRLKIWLINARELARKVVRSCIHCFKYKPKLMSQIMGNLPRDRLGSVRPFIVTGVDFCGPVYTSYRIRGKAPYKTYIAIFVCFSSKAVHIEAASDLSTNAFISVLKRFIGRRGLPAKIVCDNATNFVGTSNKLRELRDVFFNDARQRKLMDFLGDQGIEFQFIPPRSPHFGGLWEAAVKSTKNLMLRTVGNANLTFEELSTVLIEIEAVLNSRPIAPFSEDPSDGEALTPSHLLIGSALKTIPEIFSTDIQPTYTKRWQYISCLKARFWSAFHRDYLLELQCRSKWVKPARNIEIGTIVLVHEDNLPPQKWLLGRVVAVIVGKDGKIRVADIKTRSGIIRRAIHKLAMLPMES